MRRSFLTATAPVWFQVSEKGGATLFSGMLQPGQTYAVPAAATAPVLKTGKPEALTINVGNQVAPPVGPPAKTVADVSLLPSRPDERGRECRPCSGVPSTCRNTRPLRLAAALPRLLRHPRPRQPKRRRQRTPQPEIHRRERRERAQTSHFKGGESFVKSFGRTGLLAISAAFALVPASAVAQRQPPTPEQRIERLERQVNRCSGKSSRRDARRTPPAFRWSPPPRNRRS